MRFTLCFSLISLFLVSCDTNKKEDSKKLEYGRPILLLDSLNEEYSKLNKFLYVLKDEEEVLDSVSIVSQNLQSEFKPYNLIKDSLNEPYTVLWGRIKIQNNLGFDIEDWILRTGNGSYFEVYFYDSNNNLITNEKTGQFMSISKKKLKRWNKKERVLCHLPKDKIITIYIRNKRISGHRPEFKLRLSEKDFHHTDEYGERMFSDGSFLGFIFTMLLFNLVFYFGTRDITFIWQSVFLIAVSLFILEQSGFICNAPWFKYHPKSWLTITYGSIFLINITYVQFVRNYMNLRDLFPKWDKFLRYFVVANIIGGVVFILYYLISLNEYWIDD